MAEEQRPSGHLISKAIRSEQESNGEIDLGRLKKTLAKSSLWKTNTLQRIENDRAAQNEPGWTASASQDAMLESFKRSLLQLVDRHWKHIIVSSDSNADRESQNGRSELPGDGSNDAGRDVALQKEYNGMRKALAVQVKEGIKTRRRLQEQEALAKQHALEIKRLQRTISELQAENAGLTERHKDELDSQKTRLAELQGAYDQFQVQSDQLLTELDQENARLRGGVTAAGAEAQLVQVDFNTR